MFDIRQGEHRRTWAMFSYLLFVLFAYYIVKPVSRSMFLTTFDIDKLPSLYILIAVFGGFLAYLYSKLATKASLRVAVFWAMALSVLSLVVMWWLIRMRLPWMIYVLNIWVSLFSIVSVSQGWLVASNLFNTREAKRLYPLLGMGMVLGAAFGGEFTNRTAVLVGTQNLLLASALMVVLAYVSFHLAIWKSGSSVRQARAAHEEEASFSFSGMMRDIARVRHLQIIVGMMVVMYLVDTLVEYQFQAMARTGYRGDQLTAFFGQFYGIWLNGTEFLFQLFVTALVVRRFGVGGTLQIAPTAIALSSIATLLAPGVKSASAVRLTEASTRYTLNKTGMELLYMPLPLELRNRIKAFIDICVDRLSRGVAGVLLILLTTTRLHMGVRGLAVVVAGLCVPWILFSYLARREYLATIRKRLASRRLDFASLRITVHDADTLHLLESVATDGSPRQAAYAVGLLAEAPGYDVRPLLERVAANPAWEVREKVYEIATQLRFEGLLAEALKDVRAAEAGESSAPARAAVRYALAVSSDALRLTRDLLNTPNPALVEGVLDALRTNPDLPRELITTEWLTKTAQSRDSRMRALVPPAMVLRGNVGPSGLVPFFEDSEAEVVRAACSAAGELRDAALIPELLDALQSARLRRDAIAALAQFGPEICPRLGSAMSDPGLPVRLRRQIPRVLKNIPDQRSVDILLPAIKHPDLHMRAAVLKALNRLREQAPLLKFDHIFVTEQILAEARYYFELNAALAPFHEYRESGRRAARLLARTIEQRLNETLDRVFRLLGLRYPPKEIYSAYMAISNRSRADATAALEFLDNILERSVKRILLPLLDAPEHVLERGRALFGVEPRTAEEAIRELIRSGDPWLVACAMAAAAELEMRSLAPDIQDAAADAVEEVTEVARSAAAALAV